LFVFI